MAQVNVSRSIHAPAVVVFSTVADISKVELLTEQQSMKTMHIFFFLLLFLPLTTVGQRTTETHMVMDFNQPALVGEWAVVNDVVMGGVSSSTFSLTKNGTAIFKGVVSLDNNGGFASARSRPQSFNLREYQGMRLRLRGDGKAYRLRLHTNYGFEGLAYQANFDTVKDEWITVDLPFTMFEASFRGQKPKNAPPFDPSAIRQIGFLIADKQEGAFSLEIQNIEAYRINR